MKKQKSKPSENVPGCAEPTPYELATLALAISQQTALENIKYVLSHGEGSYQWEQSTPETSAKEALAIWLTAHDVLEKWRANPASVFPPEPTPTPSLSEPQRYPVTLDKFLQLMLPELSGRTGEKYGTFREYLAFRLRNPSPPSESWDREHSELYAKTAPAFDCCNPRIVPAFDHLRSYSSEKGEPAKPAEPTKDDVVRYVTLWRTKGIPDRKSFLYHERWFRDWYDRTHHADIKSKRRDAGAKGRASQKAKAQKPDSANSPAEAP